MGDENEKPLDDESEQNLSEAERKGVERNLTLKRQAGAVLDMAELMEDLRGVAELEDQAREITYGDEHFVHHGQCIAIKHFLKRMEKMAAYQPPKGGKRVNSYV